MTFLLDVNVLMAVGWENHAQHQAARAWLRQAAAFATSPLTQGGFVRVSSNPKLGFTAKPADAFKCLDSILADARHRFIPDDLSFADPKLDRPRIKHHQQVTDCYLVALARKHGLALATFDAPLAKAFAQEPGRIEWLQP
jgi:uncharacterized protein